VYAVAAEEPSGMAELARLTVPDERGVRRLVLARPAKANAMSPEMVEAVEACLERAFAAPPRVLVVEGEGRNFCAGFDFDGFEALSDAELLYRFVRIEQLLARVRYAPFPTVAAVRGAAFGAGADLVAACTFRVGMTGARLRFPGFRFGLALGTRHLTHLIGPQRAREILLAAEIVSAEQALRDGLLTDLVADAAEWSRRVDQRIALCAEVDAASAVTLLRNVLPETRDADLADLVRSAIRPGMRARIAAYRAQSAQAGRDAADERSSPGERA
jgi:enoyl-CoA hydratase/carnithine racemase